MKYAPALPLALVVLAAVAGCSEKTPLTVADFMENEAALYGTLSRCDRNPESVDPRECNSARQAAQRIATIEERALRQARDEAFEVARAEYRERLDRERALRKAAEEVARQARLEALTSSSGEIVDEEASKQPGDAQAPEADDTAEKAPTEGPGDR